MMPVYDHRGSPSSSSSSSCSQSVTSALQYGQKIAGDGVSDDLSRAVVSIIWLCVRLSQITCTGSPVSVPLR